MLTSEVLFLKVKSHSLFKAPGAYCTGGFLYFAVRRYNDCYSPQ